MGKRGDAVGFEHSRDVRHGADLQHAAEQAARATEEGSATQQSRGQRVIRDEIRHRQQVHDPGGCQQELATISGCWLKYAKANYHFTYKVAISERTERSLVHGSWSDIIMA